MTSIESRNSNANLQKTMIYFTNIDLVNDNVYTKFGLNRSIRFQDNWAKTQFFYQSRIVTLLQICRNLKTSKLSCMSSLPAIMKKIQ